MPQKTIKIKVLKIDSQSQSQFKELYRNSVSLSSDLSFDYSLIERALNVLYPSCLIEFAVSYYG